MSGSNDALTQFMMLQARNQQRQPSTQARLAQQMMQANMQQAQTPIWGTGATLARAGSGVLAGLMSGMAERSDREREQETEQRFLDRQDKQRHLWDQELTAGPPGQRPPPQQPPADIPQGAPTASGTTADMPGPTVTAAAPADPMARLQWLAGLAGRGNRAAETQLVIEREAFNRSENQRVRQEDREFQARLAAASRAPRAPSEFEQMAAAAGIRQGSPEFQQLARTMLDLRVNPPVSDPRAGLNPVQAYDAEGNPTILLPRTDGTVVRPALPEGVTLTPRTREINTGTEIQTVDQGGRVLQSRPINIRGREAAEVEGRDAGTQNVAAPGVVRQAEQTLALIDNALNHGALSTATGMLAPLGGIPGTPQFDFSQRVAQLQGRAFLDAFESLRGGGAITQIEGEKATQAIARLNRGASARDFREALQELRDIVETGRARAAARIAPQAQIGASGLAADPPNPARRLRFNPATGDFE